MIDIITVQITGTGAVQQIVPPTGQEWVRKFDVQLDAGATGPAYIGKFGTLAAGNPATAIRSLTKGVTEDFTPGQLAEDLGQSLHITDFAVVVPAGEKLHVNLYVRAFMYG